MIKKFLRRQGNLLLKLGKRRKSKQKWRRPTGRDNKMREKRKGYPAVVSTGYKKAKSEKKKFVVVNNLKELGRINDKDIFIGKVGKKKRIEIEKIAKERKIKIHNKYKKDNGDKNESK